MVDTRLLPSTHIDYVWNTSKEMLFVAASYFVCTNSGQKWADGEGYKELVRGLPHHEYEQFIKERNFWAAKLNKFLRRNPHIRTLRMLDEAWQKSLTDAAR